MATKVKNLKAVQKNLKKTIKSFKNDNKELKRAAKTIQNELRLTLREGDNFDGTPMPSLSEKTVKRRAQLLSKNKKHKDASAAKSNVTLTGDFVQKLKTIVKGNKIILFGKGKHKKYNGLRVKKLAKSNAEISDIIRGLQDKGWKILGVTDKAKDRIRKQFIQFLRRKK